MSLNECSGIYILLILFDLILYLTANNFSVMSGRVFLGYTSTGAPRGFGDLGRIYYQGTGEHW